MKDTQMFVNDELEKYTEEDVAMLERAMPQWRKEHICKIKNAQSRRESVLAFHLLQQKLVETYGITDFCFTYGENGKPRLKEYPDIHINLSHCRKAVVCAISTQPIGIDVEIIGRYKESLARYTMNEGELEEILAADEHPTHGYSDRDVIFTCLWTKKEAAAKLSGEGISTNVRDILSQHGNIKYTTHINREKGYVTTLAER